MKQLLFYLSLTLITFSIQGQSVKKVLFLGNSYTAVNNLPLMVNNMANSTGDILIYDSHTPGGYRFINHSSDATTLSKINSENWDYVVLQAQSQETSLSEAQMQAEVYPYAESLSNAIRANNECSQPMFYMTWGRENGDAANCASRPWICTYEEMDDVIKATYIFMAESNEAELTAAGAVWRYIREHHSSIDLYSVDGSHPSLAGSYAAACAIYTMIYKKDPSSVSWNSTLSESEANLIKAATKTIIFDEISAWDYTQNPISDFTEEIIGGQVSFTNTSSSFESMFWDFGDGNISTETNPIHNYTEVGFYEVSQTINKCGKSDTKTKTIEISVLSTESFERENFDIYPNPTSVNLILKFDKTCKDLVVILSDLSGKTILKTSANNLNKLMLNVSTLSKGVYILNIVAEDNIYIKKVVKS